MGDPKRIRKKYVRSKLMWNAARISRDHELKEKFGLKNLRELWKATTEVSRIRRNAREVLSNRSTEKVGKDMISRLSRYSIVGKEAKIDDLLGVTAEAILGRRLQSIVFRSGLAKTPKQARQLIAHGFIAINGRKVKSAGYMVSLDEETRIGYYKPFDLNPAQPEAKPVAPAEPKPAAKEE
jgi:small subunit ribosomal protein S4